MLVLGKSSYFREPQVGEYYYILARIYVWLFRKYFIHNGQMPWSLRSSLTWWSEISQKRTAQVSKISRNQESGKACDLPCKKKIFQGLLILEEICDILKEVNQLVDLFVSRSVTQLSERISSISNQRLSTYCKCLFLNPDKWCVFSPTNSCQGRVLHSFYIRCGWKLQMWLK